VDSLLFAFAPKRTVIIKRAIADAVIDNYAD
jgi:hypothetical protein